MQHSASMTGLFLQQGHRRMSCPAPAAPAARARARWRPRQRAWRAAAPSAAAPAQCTAPPAAGRTCMRPPDSVTP